MSKGDRVIWLGLGVIAAGAVLLALVAFMGATI